MTSILANNESNNGKEEMGKEALKKKREECLKKWRGSRKEKSRAEKKQGKPSRKSKGKTFRTNNQSFCAQAMQRKLPIKIV